MTHLCCSHCRLRFAAVASAYIKACPKCGETPRQISLQGCLGFRLFGPDDLPREPPQTLAVSVPIPGPGDDVTPKSV